MTIHKTTRTCDICGQKIGQTDNYLPFTRPGINATLHCHVPGCKQAIDNAGDDWTKLPPGPLRELYTKRWVDAEPEAQGRLPGVG